jgi:hypothetical protein
MTTQDVTGDETPQIIAFNALHLHMALQMDVLNRVAELANHYADVAQAWIYMPECAETLRYPEVLHDASAYQQADAELTAHLVAHAAPEIVWKIDFPLNEVYADGRALRCVAALPIRENDGSELGYLCLLDH